MIADANAAFPALKLTRADITLVHRGIVPAQAGKNGHAELLGAPQILDHASDGAPGAMTVIGVKYTTARAVGARAAAAAARRLGRVDPADRHRHRDPAWRGDCRSRSADHRNRARGRPGALAGDHQAPERDLRRPLRGHRPAHGRAERLADAARARPARTSARKSSTRFASRSAVTLADIVIRRMELGAMEHPGDDGRTRGGARSRRRN